MHRIPTRKRINTITCFASTSNKAFLQLRTLSFREFLLFNSRVLLLATSQHYISLIGFWLSLIISNIRRDGLTATIKQSPDNIPTVIADYH